jgi:hypothetical protein
MDDDDDDDVVSSSPRVKMSKEFSFQKNKILRQITMKTHAVLRSVGCVCRCDA